MRRSLLALTLTAAFGCTDDGLRLDRGGGDGGVFPGSDAGQDGSVDAGPRPVPVPADILVVVDNSGSMAASQDRLARAFEALANRLGEREGLRIGVVSTDLDSADGERAGMVSQTFAGTYPFQLEEIDNSSCTSLPVEHGCFRTGSGSSGVIDSTTLSTDALIAAFSEAVRLGTCGSGLEQGLDAMLLALEQDGCGAGRFIRAEANLVLIFVTDEEDSNNTPITQIVNDLARHKPLEQTRVAVIAGLWEGAAAACAPALGTACGGACANPPPEGSHTACSPGNPGDCPAGEFCDGSMQRCENEARRYWSAQNCSWCGFFAAPDCCSALAGQRYVDFARAFEVAAAGADPRIPVVGCDGSGERPVCLLESICQDDLAASMGRIASDLLLLP